MFNEINDMLVFAAVGDTGSITRAGKLLGLPKSTVSRRLGALEERLGSQLLLRSARRLVLTEAGQVLLERCQRLAHEAEDALAFASELTDQPIGTLRVTMPPDFGRLFLAHAIASFTAQYPRISLVLDESQRYVDLATERFDVAIRAGELPDSSLVARPLLAMPRGIFASPAYLARTSTPRVPADLADHQFVILEGRTRFDRFELRNEQRNEQRRAEVIVSGAITVTSGSMQQELACAGVGAIVYTEHFCADAVRAGRLVRLLPDWTSAPAPLSIVTPSRRLLPRKTVLFVEHLLATVGASCDAAARA
ncbi:MAG TPA: LysR family transcriptional regulator [Kofleriaceae bacterium]|nr:LysR family transcriptional regulator [Kofleriaceae bacterium]